ncbi:Solitary outer membrane autotransporter beta-barrel domain [Psychromonas algarum]|uniref:Solitary outer membrane autotransporter beta-barrel domain n=1 Tax=Psychromonas algarum TaxID=2555643 RepID=UPI0014197188|nr:Solitary outer membrane autotransporter beta-barrel domain [Psychromonas sp. RZ22]
MSRLNIFSVISFIGFITMMSNRAQAADELGISTIEEAFAISTLMSDSEALTFGFMNFDLKVDDPGFGNDKSSKLKNSLDVFVIPHTWYLEPKSSAWDHALTVRAFYINSRRDNELVPSIKDDFNEYTAGIYGSYSQFYHVTKNWYVESALGAYLTYYKNIYHYGDGVPDELKNKLNENTFNVSTFAAIIEPEIGIGYRKNQKWGSWRAHNNTNYIYGQGFGGSIENSRNINPEGWRLTNGVEFTVDVPELWGIDDFLTIDFKRIDVLGDMRAMAEKGHYYETSFGWVIDTNDDIPFLDNIGIGISINYGSSISGGTLVLYYNE